jgi:predicted nuclease of predicted toxin-antitoxin system
MLRLAADENFNGDIVRGLLRRNPKLDIVRVQDVGLSGADDPSVLQCAAEQGRIIVTHDISTLAKHAFHRIAAGQPMPGVFEVRSVDPVGQAIDDLILLASDGRLPTCDLDQNSTQSRPTEDRAPVTLDSR